MSSFSRLCAIVCDVHEYKVSAYIVLPVQYITVALILVYFILISTESTNENIVVLSGKYTVSYAYLLSVTDKLVVSIHFSLV